MKICPKCGGTLFSHSKAIRMTSVTVDVKDGKFIFTETEDNNTVENEVVDCLGCKARFNLRDEEQINMFVHQDKPCVKCGRKFSEEELDEECTCVICRLKEKDPSFENIENAMDFNAVRMIAMLKMDNMKLSTVNEKLEKDLEKAKEVNAKIEEKTAKPKRTGRKKANKNDSVEENTDNSDANKSEVEEVDIDNADNTENSDIEISQDIAPELPKEVIDMSNAMNPPEGE